MSHCTDTFGNCGVQSFIDVHQIKIMLFKSPTFVVLGPGNTLESLKRLLKEAHAWVHPDPFNQNL